MSDDLKVGDVVQLNSGGPNMTVNAGGDKTIECIWFPGDFNEPQKQSFLKATIKKVGLDSLGTLGGGGKRLGDCNPEEIESMKNDLDFDPEDNMRHY